MELEINETFTKHYNKYREREEAAKTKKTLKKQIKEIEEESSSSSDSDSDEIYRNQFVNRCDFVLREFENNKKNALLNKEFFKDMVPTKSTETNEKPVYAKDLNRQILLEDGAENYKELIEIENSSKIDSDFIIKQTKSSFEFDVINDDNDEDFLKPSTKPPKFVVKNVIKENSDSESEIHFDNEEDEEKKSESSKMHIEINRDRKLETVRVSKTTTRSERRKEKKERKEKELKEKMKKLKEIKQKMLQEKIDRIKKIVPQAADELILDELEEDFDVDEVSRKLTEFFQHQDGSMPIDEEKPIFSDLSDDDPIEIDSDQEEIDYDDGKINKKRKNNKNIDFIGIDKNQEKIDRNQQDIDEEQKPKKNKLKTKKKEEKTKNPFFTNLESANQKIPNKKIGIIQKTDEIFDAEKHKSFTDFLRKNFDYFCEDLIVGKAEGEGDIACRFKFRAVEQQDFGLDTEEILFTEPRELNQWVSLKKITQIRTKAEEEKDRIYYERVKERKHEVLKSLYGNGSDEEIKTEEEQEGPEEKFSLSKAARKRARKNAKKRIVHERLSGSESYENQQISGSQIDTELNEPKKKKIKFKNDSFKGQKKNQKIDFEKSDKIDIGLDELEEDETKFEKESLKKSKKKKNQKIDSEKSDKIDIGLDEHKKIDSEKSVEIKIDSEKSVKIKIDSSEIDILSDQITDEKNTSDRNATENQEGKKNTANEMANQNDVKIEKISGDQSKIKKSKKRKNESSIPYLGKSRLASIQLNEGYYYHALKATHK